MSRAGIKAGEGYVEIGIKNRIDAGAKGVQASLDKMSRKVTNLGSMIGGVGLAMSTPFVAAIKSASDMQETMGKFNIVFGESAKAVQAWSETTAAAMGTSEKEMASMLSSMQDLLVPMGVMPDTATDMSKELSKLAVDLGSFNNMDSDQVFTDMMAAMTGSGEVMKKYGVILSEAAVKQELLNSGQDPKTATEAAKAQARLAIIMRGTSAAQGDAIRTAGSLANQMKRLWAVITNTADAVGGAFIEDVSKLVGVVRQSVSGISDWIKENQGIVKAVGYVSAGLVVAGGALVAFGGFLSLASVAVGGIAAAIGFLASPIVLAVAAVAGLGVALVKYTSIGAAAVGWLKDRFGPLVQTIMDAMAAIKDAVSSGDWSKAWELTTILMESIWLDLTNSVRDLWSNALGYVLNAGSEVAVKIAGVFQSLASVLSGMLDGYKSYYDSVFEFTEDKLSGVAGAATGVRTIGDKAKPRSAFEEQFGGTEDAMRASIAGVADFGSQMEASARDQQQKRNADIVASQEARKDRLAALRAEIKIEGDTARTKAAAEPTVEEPGGDALGQLAGLIAEAENLAAEETATTPETGPEEQKETVHPETKSGEFGSFSAFAASIIGGQSNEQKMLSLTERIAKASEAALAQKQNQDDVLMLNGPLGEGPTLDELVDGANPVTVADDATIETAMAQTKVDNQPLPNASTTSDMSSKLLTSMDNHLAGILTQIKKNTVARFA